MPANNDDDVKTLFAHLGLDPDAYKGSHEPARNDAKRRDRDPDEPAERAARAEENAEHDNATSLEPLKVDPEPPRVSDESDIAPQRQAAEGEQPAKTVDAAGDSPSGSNSASTTDAGMESEIDEWPNVDVSGDEPAQSVPADVPPGFGAGTAPATHTQPQTGSAAHATHQDRNSDGVGDDARVDASVLDSWPNLGADESLSGVDADLSSDMHETQLPDAPAAYEADTPARRQSASTPGTRHTPGIADDWALFNALDGIGDARSAMASAGAGDNPEALVSGGTADGFETVADIDAHIKPDPLDDWPHVGHRVTDSQATARADQTRPEFSDDAQASADELQRAAAAAFTAPQPAQASQRVQDEDGSGGDDSGQDDTGQGSPEQASAVSRAKKLFAGSPRDLSPSESSRGESNPGGSNRGVSVREASVAWSRAARDHGDTQPTERAAPQVRAPDPNTQASSAASSDTTAAKPSAIIAGLLNRLSEGPRPRDAEPGQLTLSLKVPRREGVSQDDDEAPGIDNLFDRLNRARIGRSGTDTDAG